MSDYKYCFLVLTLTFLFLQGCTSLQDIQITGSGTSAKDSLEKPLASEIQNLPVIENLKPAVPRAGLQLGAFKEPASATNLIHRLSAAYPIVFENRVPILRAIERDATTLYRVILGPFSDEQMAQAFCQLLRKQNEVCFTTLYDRVDVKVEMIADN